MTQSDLEWPRTAKKIVWMTQYDFRWVKSICASPFWGLSDLDISIYSDSATSHRETTTLCNTYVYDLSRNDLLRLYIRGYLFEADLYSYSFTFDKIWSTLVSVVQRSYFKEDRQQNEHPSHVRWGFVTIQLMASNVGEQHYSNQVETTRDEFT